MKKRIMTSNELKKPYERLYNSKLDKYTCTEVAELYLSSSSIMEKNEYISYLVCNSWNLLQKIYYTNNNNILTVEECYDIFIQTLHYVIKSHAWTRPDSSLHNDKKAFEKAMAITIQSRRKNYLKAKFTQKRIVNNGNLSLDSLEEDFQDGYFSNYEDDYSGTSIEKINREISRKNYLAAFLLEAILYNNIFTDDHELDMRKLRKHIRHIDDGFCEFFAAKHGLNINEVKHSLDYFKNSSQDKLDKKIQNAFIILRRDDIIKQILEK